MNRLSAFVRSRILRNHVTSTRSTSSRRYPGATSREHASTADESAVRSATLFVSVCATSATPPDAVDALFGTRRNSLLVAVTIPSWETALDGS